MESGAEPGGLIRRLGGCRGDLHGAAGAGHRLWLLDPHSGGFLRHRRYSPDTRPDPELSEGAGLGPGRGARATGARCGAALMLDAMVGFSRISPISVAPPWQS